MRIELRAAAAAVILAALAAIGYVYWMVWYWQDAWALRMHWLLPVWLLLAALLWALGLARGRGRAPARLALYCAVLTLAGIGAGLVYGAGRTANPMGACLANLNQLGQALQMYASDHEGRFPPSKHWATSIEPVAKSRELFLCPNDRRKEKQSDDGLETSYTYSVRAGSLPLKLIGNPAAAGVLYDGTALRGLEEAVAFRHDHGANVCYADGHSKWISLKAFPEESALWAVAARKPRPGAAQPPAPSP